MNDELTRSVVARYGLAWQGAVVLLFNTCIAVLLTLVGDEGFWLSFVYSQCIGLSILAAIHLLALRAGRGLCPAPGDLILGIVLGTVFGSLLATLVTGNFQRLSGPGLGGFGTNLLLGIAFGAVAAYFFLSTIRMAQTRLELQTRSSRQLAMEKALAETQLRLLQAQIEPHFLFNTLSNIHGLIELDPPRAGAMLEALTRYLRATLQRTREGVTTLGDELELIATYLSIQQQRMGERLRFQIDVEPDLAALPFPPMLIQPLVENAVVHGIEPALEGGEVVVRVRATERLQVEVSDSGGGDGVAQAGNGVGLANVRARLQALFGEAALCERVAQGQGSRVTLELPLPVRQREAA